MYKCWRSPAHKHTHMCRQMGRAITMYYVQVLTFWCSGQLLCTSADLLMFRAITMYKCWPFDVRDNYYVQVLTFWCSGQLLCTSADLLMFRAITMHKCWPFDVRGNYYVQVLTFWCSGSSWPGCRERRCSSRPCHLICRMQMQGSENCHSVWK